MRISAAIYTFGLNQNLSLFEEFRLAPILIFLALTGLPAASVIAAGLDPNGAIQAGTLLGLSRFTHPLATTTGTGRKENQWEKSQSIEQQTPPIGRQQICFRIP